MRKIVTCALILLGLSPWGSCLAGETVSVPWEDFKKLYRESIERELTPVQIQPPLLHTIERAAYSLSIGPGKAEGTVTLSGRLLSGKPVPIPLFGQEVAIARLETVAGGSLLCDKKGISFLPDGNDPFKLVLVFLVRPQEDSQSQFVSFHIPQAVSNSLSLTLDQRIHLAAAPGIGDAHGVYQFSSCSMLTIRFADEKDLVTKALIEIDSLSQIRFQAKRVFVTTHFLPVRPVTAPFIVTLPSGSRFVSSSLKGSWIERLEGDRYRVSLPSEARDSFSVQFVLEAPSPGEVLSLILPTVEENSGEEGCFILEQPDGAAITIESEESVRRIPVSKLAQPLRPAAGFPSKSPDGAESDPAKLPRSYRPVTDREEYYLQIASGEALRLSVKTFELVATPPTVLDAIHFFTAFAENGTSLSVLKMEIPAGTGSRFSLKRIPGAEIWSLKVNGASKKVYAADGDNWVIPLASGEPSRVELAFLSKGPKLALQGRLETMVPETGVAARNVYLGIALPKRVELVSIEGSLSAEQGRSFDAPKEFMGIPYYFSRSFYKGEAMHVAVFYKEPVEESAMRKGAAR